MANIREYRDKNGRLISFYIKVHRGKGLTPYHTTFKVDPSWTEKRARKEAEKFAIIYEEKCKSKNTKSSNVTLAEYMNYYLELKIQRDHLKRRSISIARGTLRRITEEIGYIKLKDLTVSDLNNFYTRLGETLSARSVCEYHSFIKTALSQAVREDVLEKNVAQAAMIPKVQKKEPRYFQREEIEVILNAADQEPIMWRCFIYTLVFTGCRRGEILGLKWEDLDFESGKIFVHRSILYTQEDGLYEETTKTPKSVRHITLPKVLLDLLLELKEGATGEFIFSADGVHPVHPHYVSTYLARFSKKYDLPHLNAHAFRHTMASMLYHEGMDSVSISARLGHSQVSTTANIYAHKVDKSDDENVQKLEQLYLQNREKK